MPKPKVTITERFDLIVDGRSLGSYTREQLASLRADITHLLARTRRDRILLIVTDYFGLEPDELLKNKSRYECILWPRHAAITLLREYGLSSIAIGEMFHQDHATILKALIRTRERIETDPIHAEQLATLRDRLSPTLNLKP